MTSSVAANVWTWLAGNFGAVLAGVISSVLVLMGQMTVIVLSRLIIDKIGGRRSLRRMVQMDSPSKIYLVSGSIEELERQQPAGPAFLAAPDAAAVASLRIGLRLLYPHTEILHTFAPEFSRDLYGANVVTIGGPINNRCTRDFLSELPLAVSFEGLDLTTPSARYELAEIDPVLAARDDYGLIVSAENPFDSRARCVVIAGCDSGGVLAASMIVSPDPLGANARRQIRRLMRWSPFRGRTKAFFAVIRTRATRNIASAPVLVEFGRITGAPVSASSLDGRPTDSLRPTEG